MEGSTDQEGNQLVWVVDYEKLKNSESEVIPVEKALEHPQTIPFIGSKKRAEQYLERHQEVYGDRIGIWHSNDLYEEPLARLLVVGYSCSLGLVGSDGLVGGGRFLGVRAESTPRKIQAPTQEQISRVIQEFVAPVNSKEVEDRINALYE